MEVIQSLEELDADLHFGLHSRYEVKGDAEKYLRKYLIFEELEAYRVSTKDGQQIDGVVPNGLALMEESERQGKKST